MDEGCLHLEEQVNDTIHHHPVFPLFLDGPATVLAVGGGLVPAQEPGRRLTLHQEDLPRSDVPRRHRIPPPDAFLKVQYPLAFIESHNLHKECNK